MLPLHLHLKSLVSDNLGEALQILGKVFANNRDAFNTVVIYTARLKKLNAEKYKGALSTENENIELSKLFDAVLALIDQITPEEAAAYELENAVFKRILVVCKSAGREEYMRRLFPEQYFKGVEYDVSEKPRAAESVNRFDLVIFDNYPHGAPDDPHDLLKYYLEQTQPYLLYFGSQQLNLLREYPEKAYFANSIFSLHGRLREMIEFLKYYSTTGNL
jgi:hypothetical protein